MMVPMRFDTETYVRGQFPEFGAIFMSNIDTKNECFRRKLLGLPSWQADFVKGVKTGMILFLFEFDRRELHGVFQACSDGAINIVPNAFRSSGKQFPAQVKFTPIWRCSPLPESEFCDAIRENYFSVNKFNFGLSEEQVRKLLSLFNLRKLRDKHFDGLFTQIKVAKEVGCSANESRNVVGDGCCLTINDEKDEENANVNYGSTGNECCVDYINNYIRAIDADICATDSVSLERKLDSDFEMFLTNKQFGNPLDRLGRSVGNFKLLTSNEIGNEHAVDIDPTPVCLTGYPWDSFATVSSIHNRLSDTVVSGEESKWNEHNAFQSSVSTRCPDFFQSDPVVYPSKYISAENSLINDQLQHYSAVDRSVAQQNLNVSHPISCQDAVVMDALHYDPDVPALNYVHSSPSWTSKSVCGYSMRDTRFPHRKNQSLPSYIEPPIRSWCTNLNSDESVDVPMSFPDSDTFLFSEKIHSVSEKKRKSVFSRLTLQSDLSEQRVAHVGYDVDSSVDEVMALVHQSNYDWLKATSFKKFSKRQDDMAYMRRKRQVTVKSRLSKDNLAKISTDIGRHCTSGEEIAPKAERIPMVDFRRRSELRKLQDEASREGLYKNVEKDRMLDGEGKRRKLIRPNFNVYVASNKSPQNVEFVNTSFPLTGSEKSNNLVKLDAELEKSGIKLGNNEAVENNCLESVIGQCSASVSGNIHCSNIQESSQGSCGENPDQLVASKGNDCEMDIHDNIENGNRTRTLPSCCETITGPPEFCSPNQNLTSCEEPVDGGRSSDTENREIPSVEFIQI